jgi:hypothetical protein
MRKYDDLMRWVVGGAGYVKAIHSVISNKGSSMTDRCEAIECYESTR